MKMAETHIEHVAKQTWKQSCLEGSCQHRQDGMLDDDLTSCPCTPVEVCIDCMDVSQGSREARLWEAPFAPWPHVEEKRGA